MRQVKPLLSVVCTLFLLHLSTTSFAQYNLPAVFGGTNGPVNNIINRGDTVLVAGDFSHVFLADSCKPFGVLSHANTGIQYAWPQPNGMVTDVIADGRNGFYLCGTFTTVGDSSRSGFAHIDSSGKVTTVLAGLTFNNQITKLLLVGDTLYIAGTFSTVGSQTRNRLAAVLTTSGAVLAWNPNVNNTVADMLRWQNTVYIAGQFTTVGGQARSFLANVDATSGALNTTWNPSPNNAVMTLELSPPDSQLYIGGSFTSVNGFSRICLASVNAYTGLQSTLSTSIFSTGNVINDMQLVNGNLYIGGRFNNLTVGPNERSNFVIFNPQTYNIKNSTNGTNGEVNKLAVVNGKVYLAGSFSKVLYYAGSGTYYRSNFAVIDTVFGTLLSHTCNTNARVGAMVVRGNDVFLGGNFRYAGGVKRSGVAAILASTGQALPWHANTNSEVYDLSIDGNKLYLVGVFTTAGNNSSSRIYGAAFNLTNGALLPWAIPTLGGEYYAVEAYRDIIYVGGYFESISPSRRGLCAFDTLGNLTPWNPYVTGYVATMVRMSNSLYVGGAFSAIGSSGRNNIADVSITTGMAGFFTTPCNGGVHKLAFSPNGYLYVSGSFTQIGASNRNGLACFIGSSLTAWNPNPNGVVNDFAFTGNIVYVGGNFTTIAGSSRVGIAAFGDDPYFIHALLPWYPATLNTVKAIHTVGLYTFIGGTFSSSAGPSHLTRYTGVLNLTNSSPGSLCKGSLFQVIFRTNASAYSGNVFTAQLSDSSGSFANPILLDSIARVSSDTIRTRIPMNVIPGTKYRIRVVASNPSFGTFNDNGYNITIHHSPQTGFTINTDTLQCFKGNRFSFNDTSRIQQGTLTRQWNFGDNTSTIFNPIPGKSYSSSGIYQVKLVNTSNLGCKDSLIKNIRVLPRLYPSIFVNAAGQCLDGNSFLFSDSSKIDAGGSFARLWVFSSSPADTSTLQTPTARSYSTVGTYSVKLKLTSTEGCVDSAVQQVTVHPQARVGYKSDKMQFCLKSGTVVFTDTSSISSGTLIRVWQFGDNTTDTVLQPVKQYMQSGLYQVKLISMSDKGCKDSITKAIEVYPQTAAMFSVNDSTQCLQGHQFMFTNESVLPTGSFTSGWSFGDNTTSGVHHPVKQYTTTGQYQVRLITTTGNGCKDTAVRTIQVYAHPTSSFSTDSVQCLTGNQFVMNNTSSGSPVSYHWDFGNSSTSVTTNPSVSYASAGNYSIQLVAQNSFGCNDTVVKNVRVKQSPAIPTFTTTPDTIVCDNISIVLKTGDPHTRTWMKDSSPLGVSADSLVVTNSAGSYWLKVTNSENCDATSKPVNVFFKPTPVKPAVTIAGQLLTSSSATGNQWYSSTGAIAGANGQTYTANTVGSYYTVVTQNGCSSIPSDVVSYPATGMASISKNNSVSVYPNPNNGSFTISLPEHISEEIDIQVNDLTGKTIWSQSTVASNHLIQVQPNQLANGVYVVVLKTSTKTHRVSLIINR